MSTCQFAIIKPKKTDRKLEDFNIFAIKDIGDKQTQEEQESLINNYIDELISEFVEFKDLKNESFSDIVEDMYCSDNEFTKEYLSSIQIPFQNKKIYETEKYCYRLLYPYEFEKEPEIQNYLSSVIEGEDAIYSECIISKFNIENKTYEGIDKDEIHKIIYDKLISKGFLINFKNNIYLDVGFFTRDFYNMQLGAFSFLNKETANIIDIDLTCGKLLIAYDTQEKQEHKKFFDSIDKNDKQKNLICEFLKEKLSHILEEENMKNIANCILMYQYSFNGYEINYNISIMDLCKILEYEKQNIESKCFSRINCSNYEKLESFYVFNEIKNIKLPFEEMKN